MCEVLNGHRKQHNMPSSHFPLRRSCEKAENSISDAILNVFKRKDQSTFNICQKPISPPSFRLLARPPATQITDMITSNVLDG